MFGSIGPTELILIFIIALLVFGPKKLPDVGKSVGKAIREFKKASDEIKGRIEEEIQASEIKDVHKEIQSGMNSLRDGIRDIAGVTGVTELKKEIASATDLNAPPSPPAASQVPFPDPYAQPDPGRPETGSSLAAQPSAAAETGVSPASTFGEAVGTVSPVASTPPGTNERGEPSAATAVPADPYSQLSSGFGETPSASAPAPGPKSTTSKRPRAPRPVAKTSPQKSKQKHAQGASRVATRPAAKSREPASLAKSSGRTKRPNLRKAGRSN